MRWFKIERTDYPMQVHSFSCRDSKSEWIITGETVNDAVKSEADILNREFDKVYEIKELFRIMPCCK